MRLIDADKLIDALDDKIIWTNQGWEDVTSVIYEQPTIPQWIPVSERLPREGEEVLCTHRGKFGSAEQVVEHTYLNGGFVFNWAIDTDMTSPTFGEYLVGEVIAWMPLPKPYKESEEK